MSSTTASDPKTVAVSRTVAAPADTVWKLISDVTRMGEWSPETTACEWRGGASAAVVGAKFSGTNQNGKKKWSTMSVVSACEPGKSFVFDTTVGPLKISRWAYAIEDSGTADAPACTVTETWTDRRNRLAAMFGKPASGVSDRNTHNRAGMETTLANLAAAAEKATAG